MEGFRAICTIDSHGESLHKTGLEDSGKELSAFAEKVSRIGEY